MTTPTPGQPLSEADVSLLQPGDWLLHLPTARPSTFIGMRTTGRGTLLIKNSGGSDFTDRFTFLGRPDQDGWIAWSGGPRPHPPQTIVRVRYRDGTEDEGQSAFARWWHEPNEADRDIIAYRIVPHAPVSRPAGEGETTQHTPRCWGRTSYSDEMAHCYCKPAGEGEREAVAILKGIGKIDGDGWKDTTTKGEVVYVWNAEKPSPYAPGQYPRIGNEGWSASTSQYDFTPATADDVPAILSLLRPAAPDAGGGDDELIARSLRTIHAYDAVRYLRDALSATTARLTGYDWNADPDGITRQQGDAFAAADKVFADLSAAVDAHPDIDLPECEACSGTGKIEESARTTGANQHSACIRTCDECDGCGFAPDDSALQPGGDR